MPTISMKDLNAKAQELGTIGDALKWARANGFSVDTDTELPPLAVQPNAMQSNTLQSNEGGMDETDNTETEDTGAMGGLDLATLDFNQIKSDPGAFFKTLVDANVAAEQRAAQSAKQLYDAGRQRIMEKYAGPSQAEQLFALSRAMLSPRKVPGFKGFLGNVVGSLDENAQALREAEQKREEQLFALQQQYQQGEAARLAARPRTAADLAAKYISANTAAAKANAPVRGIAVGNRLVNPYTNQDIEPPVGTIKMYKGRKYQYMGGGDQYDQNNWKEVR